MEMRVLLTESQQKEAVRAKVFALKNFLLDFVGDMVLRIDSPDAKPVIVAWDPEEDEEEW